MWANSNIWRNNEWDFSRTYIKDINSGIQELQPTSSRENTDKTILRHLFHSNEMKSKTKRNIKRSKNQKKSLSSQDEKLWWNLSCSQKKKVGRGHNPQ